MKPVNTDKNKINRISFMVIDGFNIKKGTIKDVTKNCLNLLEKEKKCFVFTNFIDSLIQPFSSSGGHENFILF